MFDCDLKQFNLIIHSLKMQFENRSKYVKYIVQINRMFELQRKSFTARRISEFSNHPFSCAEK